MTPPRGARSHRAQPRLPLSALTVRTEEKDGQRIATAYEAGPDLPEQVDAAVRAMYGSVERMVHDDVDRWCRRQRPSFVLGEVLA